MFKIAVIADSLSMPRVENDESILYEETWPLQLQFKLRDAGINTLVLNGGKRTRTTDELAGQDFNEYINFFKPHFIILQVGIVDAMPRVISKNVHSIINQIWFPEKFKKIYIKYRSSRRRIVKEKDSLNKVYTKPERFDKNLNTFLEMIKVKNIHSEVLLLPIVFCEESFTKKSPHAKKNSIIYNNIIKKHLSSDNEMVFHEILSQFQNNFPLFCRDGYHLSQAGHDVISNIIKDYLLTTYIPANNVA